MSNLKILFAAGFLLSFFAVWFLEGLRAAGMFAGVIFLGFGLGMMFYSAGKLAFGSADE